jgi:hypothetical protein
LTLLILGGGLVPQPGVASRYHAAIALIALRERNALNPQALESQALESQALESQALESQALESRALESQALESQAWNPRVLSPLPSSHRIATDE